MDNHYHLLLETPEPNLSAGMRQLNGTYTQKFNWRRKRAGHLFQGRYKAIVVDKQTHLLELCRYIVLNPVKAKLVSDPDLWKWSSYRATLGRTKRPPFLFVDWLLSQFGTERKAAVDAFRAFVSDGLDVKSPWKDVKGQILIGGEDFIKDLRGMLKAKEPLRELPKAQRYAARPSLEEIFPPRKLRERHSRCRGCYEAHVLCGYTLAEIAAHIGVHYTTVSRMVIKGESK